MCLVAFDDIAKQALIGLGNSIRSREVIHIKIDCLAEQFLASWRGIAQPDSRS